MTSVTTNFVNEMETISIDLDDLEKRLKKCEEELRKANGISNPYKKIEMLENIKIPNACGLRSINGSTEKKRLCFLTENPEKIFSELKSLNPPIHAIKIQEVGGRKSYDLEVTDNNGKIWTIEHKGFSKYCDIQKGAPWIKTTPQIVNVIGSKIELSSDFAQYWFLNIIPLLRDHYCIKEPMPSFEKYIKDIYKNSPSDLFMIELKNKIKKDKTFADEHWKSSHKAFIENYLKDDEKYLILKKTIIETIEKKLSKKDIWLNIQYSSEKTIEPDWENFIWSLSYVPSITSFKVSRTPKITKDSATILYSYTTDIGGEKIYNGHARMRFRNQIGFNLSWNLS